MLDDKIIVFIPIKIVSEANNTNHWSVKRRRSTALQWAIIHALKNMFVFSLPCTITFERIGKRFLDYDNLVHAFKSARDIVAKIVIDSIELQLDRPIGQYDSDPRLTFIYSQKSFLNGFEEKRPLGFTITIEKNHEIN